MFATPRIKKSALSAPPPKKRKTVHTVEEINFDNSARATYLTGFHKRKQERIKKAQAQAAERDRLERIELRKQIREERKQQLEEHVQNVQRLLKEHRDAGQEDFSGSVEEEEEDEEWAGFEDDAPAAAPSPEPVDHEEEYIDEDRYTTVKVEAVSIDRDGFHKPEDSEDDEEAGEKGKPKEGTEDKPNKANKDRPKKRKKKFRYESKIERQLTERKQKAKKAKARA